MEGEALSMEIIHYTMLCVDLSLLSTSMPCKFILKWDPVLLSNDLYLPLDHLLHQVQPPFRKRLKREREMQIIHNFHCQPMHPLPKDFLLLYPWIHDFWGAGKSTGSWVTYFEITWSPQLDSIPAITIPPPPNRPKSQEGRDCGSVF
jgi:hypothetical protein